ncbi:MAG: LysM peptidoglycan-binding domain-containing protein [Chloroflexota bacterium]
MRRFRFVFLLLALGLCACALQQPETIVITATFPAAPSNGLPTLPQGTPIQPTDNPARPSLPPTGAQDYTVESGDTLSAIANANGLTVDTLLSVNNLSNPDNLLIGQVIHLPAAPTQEGSAFKILPDSRLVRAPGSSKFDVQAFINQQPGFLRNATDMINNVSTSGAQVVQRIALEYSVDPRLLLALLEYKSKLLSNPSPTDTEKNYALGAPVSISGNDRHGLYFQLAWAADQLNYGYYGWNLTGLTTVAFIDNSRILFARSLNAATVGVQYLLSQNSDYPTWQQAVGENGFYRTYINLFGDPFAGALASIIPDNLQQPTLTFPFPSGVTWYFTGGPHGGWGDGSAWSAVDFAPPDDITTVTSSCYVSQFFSTAVAPGVIARTAEGVVILDLDGDGDESTGWTILYLHMAAQDRVQAGTVVQAGDQIGHPSCEGGVSTGTHMHIARRYNGEWIPVSCNDACAPGIVRPSLIMSGWTFYGLPDQLYQGGLLRQGERRVADQGRNDPANQVNW